AGIQDRLGDGSRVDLLDRDIQAGLSAGYELDDHLVQIIGRAKLGRPDIGLDLPISKARHRRTTSPFLGVGTTSTITGHVRETRGTAVSPSQSSRKRPFV